MSYTVISYDFFYDAIYFLIIYGKGIHQLIFGGKTKRCEPQLPIPVNTYYDHTANASNVYNVPEESRCSRQGCEYSTS